MEPVRLPPQLSAAVAPGITAPLWHSTVMVPLPTSVITGGSTSSTVNVLWHVAVSSAESVTVRVMIFAPALTRVPAGGFCVTVTQQQLSVATTSAVMSGTAALQAASATAVRFVGQLVMTGGAGFASRIVTSTRPMLVPPSWPSLTR